MPIPPESMALPNVQMPRRYDIDALRVIAFFILIFYHAAMIYVADWGFHIKSDYQSQWLKYPMILVNQWRMPLLFIVSGIASSFLLRRTDSIVFIKRRSYRLMLPFFVGVLLVIPPQAYIQAMANGTIARYFGEMSYLDFLWHYFSFQAWPENAFDGSEYGFTWNHLWFVPYLFTYTLILIPLHHLFTVPKFAGYMSKVCECFVNLPTLIIFPVILQIVWQLTLNDEKPISHALIDDGYAHGMYLTYFLIGYLISDRVNVWDIILRLRWWSLSLGIICYCSLIFLWTQSNQAQWQDHLTGIIETFNQWLWLLAVLGLSAKYLNKPWSWLRYSNKAIYPWYIFHQTITIIAAYYLSRLSLGGIIEASLVIVVTFLSCLGLTEFLIRRVDILKIMFGLR